MNEHPPGELPPVLEYEKPHIASAIVRMPVVLFGVFLLVGILVASQAQRRYFPPRISMSGMVIDQEPVGAVYEMATFAFVSFIAVLTSCLHTGRYVWRDHAALVASIAGFAEVFIWAGVNLLIYRYYLPMWVSLIAAFVVIFILPALVVRHGLLTQPPDARVWAEGQ